MRDWSWHSILSMCTWWRVLVGVTHVLLVLLVSSLYAVVLNVCIQIWHSLSKCWWIIAQSTRLIIQAKIALVTVRHIATSYWTLAQVIWFILIVFSIHLNNDVIPSRRYNITIRCLARFVNTNLSLWIIVVIAWGAWMVASKSTRSCLIVRICVCICIHGLVYRV